MKKKSIGFQLADEVPVSVEHEAQAAAAVPASNAVIKFGMVKIGRTYQTIVAQPPSGPVTIGDIPNAQLKLHVEEPEGRLVVQAVLHAEIEGHFETPVTLSAGGQKVVVVITGHVMGVGKGTPSLRDGVVCISKDEIVASEDDSEAESGGIDRAGTIRAKKKTREHLSEAE